MPRDISARWTVVMARAGVCTRSLMGDGCTVARHSVAPVCVYSGGDQRRAPFVTNTDPGAQIVQNSFGVFFCLMN